MNDKCGRINVMIAMTLKRIYIYEYLPFSTKLKKIKSYLIQSKSKAVA